MEQTNPLPNPPTPPGMPINPPVSSPSSNKSILIVLLVVLLVVLFSLATYLLVKSQTKSQTPISSPSTTQPSSAQPSTVIPSPTTDPTANWKTYTSPDGIYSFKYPVDWFIYPGQSPLGPSASVMCNSDQKQNSCDKPGNTIDLFAINLLIYNSVNDYLNKNELLREKDYRKISFNGNEAVEVAFPAGPQAGGSILELFVVYKGKGYNLQYRYPGLLDTKYLKDFPEPNPNILSTFQFLD